MRPGTLVIFLLLVSGAARALPDTAAIDEAVQAAMAAAQVQGLAVGVVEAGRVVHAKAYGRRNAAGDPLRADSIMNAASLTKPVFAYTVLQLADEGRIDLDAPIGRYVDGLMDSAPPDPRDARWRALAADERWQRLTPRLLLSHRGGLANLASADPRGRARFHFEPGARYAYSGTGYALLQWVLERGLGLDLGREMQARVFDRFAMFDTSMTWRDDFAEREADGLSATRRPLRHVRRLQASAAGSMDTTIEDYTHFAAGLLRGDGLSVPARNEITRAQAPIRGARQFPTLAPEDAGERQRTDLAAGLGVVVFQGPQGPGFFKGGHGPGTGNTWVCIEVRSDCVVLLGNDVRAEALFPGLVATLLGDVGVPWPWEYGP